MMKSIRTAATLAFAAFAPAALAAPTHAILWKNPQCSCCEAYAAYMKAHGFDIALKPTNDLTQISAKAGVPADMEGCHTMFIDGYAFDGLVPADIVRKVLAERPQIAGVTLPGMPTGAPGMPGTKAGPLKIYAFTKDGRPPFVYAVE
ncbi:MAG: CopG family transcriptional regulator [Hyphomicrobiales bacterium]|nr:CopG family transcriptional regulator [Hyphomicrobiales bacterium]MDE2016744.1 CopG family transcriptional regulator [Hyphomicrobiales bacterium]